LATNNKDSLVVKLVIFSPATKSSAIGRSISLVTHALKKCGHTIMVVRSEDTSMLQAETHDFGVELIPWTSTERVAELVRNADAVVHQIGDNYTYHRGCLEWIYRAPGVICLHDFFLGHLFCGWARTHMTEALATLQAWYGEDASSAYFGHSATENFIAATQGVAPLTEWICSMGCGVITHSSWGIRRVLDSCPGPVEVVALAYDAPPSGTMKIATGREKADGDFNVLTVGHVNPNKRAESVIRAIGDSPVLRKNTTYRLVGYIPPELSERLTTLASNLQVKLVISGEADARTLSQAISQAHVVCCLRWPSLEAASASAIEAMLYGKPVIVTDTGFYAELPDSCVRKIRPDNEIPDLQQALESLQGNESERLALGAQAAEWAAATFCADNYAARLIEVSLATQASAPMLKATRALARMLGQWEASPSLTTSTDLTEPLSIFNRCEEAAQNSIDH
jgi:glycosyltransferase involved in cell wall biosynthesis